MNQTLSAPQHFCPSQEKDKFIQDVNIRKQFTEAEFQDIINQLKCQTLKPSARVKSALLLKLKHQIAEKEIEEK